MVAVAVAARSARARARTLAVSISDNARPASTDADGPALCDPLLPIAETMFDRIRDDPQTGPRIVPDLDRQRPLLTPAADPRIRHDANAPLPRPR